MKTSELRKIIKEEISKVLNELENPYNPHTKQGELFDFNEQFDMTKPQIEAYNAWKKAVNIKYGDKVQLYPSNYHKGRNRSFPFVSFDLKRGSSSLLTWITIYDDGKVKLPISFYRLNSEEKPDWMYRAQGRTLRPITMNDVPLIVKGLE
jgi:hypothetical protein